MLYYPVVKSISRIKSNYKIWKNDKNLKVNFQRDFSHRFLLKLSGFSRIFYEFLFA